MILSWMLYSVVVSGLLAGTAFLVERTLRVHRREGRWVWIMTMTASVGLSIWGLARMQGWLGAAADGGLMGGVSPESAPAGLQLLSLEALSALLPAPALLERLEVPLIAGWIILSLLCVLSVSVGTRRMRQRLAGWLRANVDGETVLVSPDFGPALVGLTRPRIVLPRWTLQMAQDRLAMILLHEREHLAARDLWTVAGGFVLAALLPWNPALWWQHSRLRLAVEADCDRRVLRRGVSPAGYGRLLLEVGQGGRSRGFMAAALMEPPSQLERRLKMMMKTERGWMASIGMMAAGALLLVAACETPAPTATPAEDALVQKSGDEGLHAVAEGERADMEFGEEARKKEFAGQLQKAEEKRIRVQADDADSNLAAEPLIFVDGVRMEGGKGALAGLESDDIESISVLKGASAIEQYGPEGADGVILIKMKAGAGG